MLKRHAVLLSEYYILVMHLLTAANRHRLSEKEPKWFCSKLPDMRSVGDIALNLIYPSFRKSKRV